MVRLSVMGAAGALLLFASASIPRAEARQREAVDVRIPSGVTRLDDIGLYEVRYRYLDGRSGALPIGWTGEFDEETGVSCIPYGVQNGRSAFLLHPVWRGGVGDADQVFHLRFPKARRITLRFAVAMRSGYTGPGRSDGATFRVLLDGRMIYDRNQTTATWAPAVLDLTACGGRSATLRFETDPGPRHDPGFDFALWGDRELSVAGAPGQGRRALFPPREATLGPTHSDWGCASPTSPVARPGDLRLQTSTAPGRRGLFDGWAATVVNAQGGPRTPPIGLGFGASLGLVSPDGKVVRSDAPQVRCDAEQRLDAATGVVHRSLRYTVGGRVIRVSADLYPPHGHSIKAEIRSDDPYIASVRLGDIGPVAFRQRLVVPYLGYVAYLPELGLFSNVIPDHTLSHASALDGVTALYQALTDGRRNPVRETAYFAISDDLSRVLPTAPNPASPYRKLLGDKIVLDVWGGSFADNAADLRELASYHLTHLATIAHVWQNGGYDNKLPNVLPALADLGGDAGMKTWVRTAEQLGEPIALHENYVDYYPNAAAYDENDVARDSRGERIPAWKNVIQSYAVAPTAILKYARIFTPEVQEDFHPNASYLDVHSAVPPWFHVDFRADQPGAGEFRTVFNAHRDLWRLFRQVHRGPVLGEGNQHWYWSGLLDGVEAQFGTGVRGNGGETAPLFVDFDLLKIHPLQFNHGMGYTERWLDQNPHSRTAMDGFPTPVTQDQYRMQEVAYGHAGFVGSLLVRNLPFVWQEHNLVWPVTARYAEARPVSIHYEVNGKLLDTNAAVAAGAAFDRVAVQYQSGLRVYANGRSNDWRVGAGSSALTLPRFGWLAEGAGVRAYTALIGGTVVDYAETATSIFANARTTVAAPPARTPARPSVAAFHQSGPGAFQIQYAWQIGGRLPVGLQQFVHYSRANRHDGEEIAFQSGAGFSAAPDTWPTGSIVGEPVDVHLPPDLPEGAYDIEVGLWFPQGGGRLPLLGDDDGTRRIHVGTLTVSGGRITFIGAAKGEFGGAVEAPSDRAAHVNSRRAAADFGKLITDGSVLLERERPGVWLLTPFPRDKPFTVSLRGDRIDPAFRGIMVEGLGREGKAYFSAVLGRSAAHRLDLRVNVMPDVVRYRLTALREDR